MKRSVQRKLGYTDRMLYGQCAWLVEPEGYLQDRHQCTRSAGHGPEGKYCPQHGKKYSARTAGDAKGAG